MNFNKLSQNIDIFLVSFLVPFAIVGLIKNPVNSVQYGEVFGNILIPSIVLFFVIKSLFNKSNELITKNTNSLKNDKLNDKKELFRLLSIYCILFTGGFYGFYLMGFNIFIIIIIILIFGFLGKILGRKIKNGKIDNIINWLNIILWIIPYLGYFSSIYSYTRFSLEKKNKYFYLGLIGLSLSTITMIYQLLVTGKWNGEYSFLNMYSIIFFLIGIVLGFIYVYIKYNKYLIEKK